MRSKLLTGVAALVLAACTIAASVEIGFGEAMGLAWRRLLAGRGRSRRGWRRRGGGNFAALGAGLLQRLYNDGYNGGYNVSGYNNGGYYDYYPGNAYAPAPSLPQAATTPDGARRITAHIIRLPAPLRVMTGCNTPARSLNEPYWMERDLTPKE